jgi:type IX secretion system PorP/SprF family membrane protein
MNWKFYFKHIFFASICVCSSYAHAQDWHYSQFHSSPTMINPAFTGLFNGDIRVIGNYREQWGFAAPYQTFSLSADGAYSILKNGDFASVGINLLADQAGDLDFTTMQTAISAAYSKALSGYGNHFLTLGLQAGINRRSVDYTNVVSVVPEPLATEYDDSFSYLDMAVGASWYFLPSDEIYMFVGGAWFHFNEPNQSFLKNESDILESRYSLHAGMQFPIMERLNILPSFMINTQGPHTEFLLGTYLKYKISHRTVNQETALYGGVWYRTADAAVLSVRYDYNTTIVGLSYDVNTSQLSSASYGRGGLELNVIYIIDKKFNISKRMKTRSYSCPKF